MTGFRFTYRSILQVGRLRLTVEEWAECMGLTPRMILARLHAGWTLVEALDAPERVRLDAPASVRMDGVRYEHDRGAQQFVAEHPDGGTLEELGEYFGVTRERARQIEADALRKFRARATGDLAELWANAEQRMAS